MDFSKMEARKKKIVSDFLFGTAGLVIMNAVLSLLVYPYLGRTLGAEGQGRILYYTSLMSLLASTFGSGANYGRMKIYAKERKTHNGEYNIFLLISFGIMAAVTVGMVLFKRGDTADANVFALILLILVTTVRFYADVEYRLSLKYKRFSLYYVIIAAGYLIGLGLYPLTHSWVLILIIGEAAGLIFVAVTGSIFKKPFFDRSPAFGKHLGILFVISLSFFLSDFVAGADRLLLPLLLPNGNELTSIFYYASLVGKLTSLLSTPLNGVLSGHIAKAEGGLTRKGFLKIVLIMLGVFAVVTAIAVAGSHLFVYWRYNQYYDVAKPLFLLANAGHVIFFICNTMMVVVLRYVGEKVQMITSAVYIALFLGVTVPLILQFGIWGMAWGIFGVNLLKFLLYVVLGLIGLRKAEKKAIEEKPADPEAE